MGDGKGILGKARRGRESVLVIGLGRFGGTLALELEALGNEVMGVDTDARIVQGYEDKLTRVLAADTTDAATLRQLGIEDFAHVVLGIGDVEASILTAAELVAMGVTGMWAKAITDAHARILERVGVEHVIRPEHDMGKRVAHRVTGKMIDYIPIDEDGTFALVETEAPTELVGVQLAQAGIRQRYDVTVVCFKPKGGSFTYATADTIIGPGDVLLVAGENAAVEAFAQLS